MNIWLLLLNLVKHAMTIIIVREHYEGNSLLTYYNDSLTHTHSRNVRESYIAQMIITIQSAFTLVAAVARGTLIGIQFNNNQRTKMPMTRTRVTLKPHNRHIAIFIAVAIAIAATQP